MVLDFGRVINLTWPDLTGNEQDSRQRRETAYVKKVHQAAPVSGFITSRSIGTQVPAHWHALSESLLNPNAGTRAAEKTKTDNLKHNLKLLCQQLGMDFVGTVHLHSDWRHGGAVPGTVLSGSHTQWSRVAAEDEAMNIGKLVARRGR